jgi:transposase-like protein
MIEWAPLVKMLGYGSDAEMWTDLYKEKNLSIAQISRKLDVSRNVVRDALGKAGLTLRKRGGPNNSRVLLSEAVLTAVRRDGIAVVAKRHGVSYATFYKRLRLRGISVKSLRETTNAKDPGDREGLQTDAVALIPSEHVDEVSRDAPEETDVPLDRGRPPR